MIDLTINILTTGVLFALALYSVDWLPQRWISSIAGQFSHFGNLERSHWAIRSILWTAFLFSLLMTIESNLETSSEAGILAVFQWFTLTLLFLLIALGITVLFLMYRKGFG